ncbi:uncharacterized protein LOC116683731 [Etheostoma spectabile]|uniref:uncharacterized protein LOC116683731 n=1 Tax=Etheostoma spectabile TaxID=54343 RepID=UPI0013AEB2DE|nr:uncharacterized protein LOC116683731 [Etheostoma spectabile]
MTGTEMDQLANYLGHDIRIHREYYRLPEKTLQLAKISKVLMALEQGKLAEFHGKNLDEISIEPDEKVLDSDVEDLNIQEENCSSVHAEGILPPAKGNERLSSKRRNPPPSDDEMPSSREPSADGTLPPTKGNERPSSSKRRKPPPSDDEMPSGLLGMKPSSKGTATVKKKSPWNKKEVQAVERHMNHFITSCVVPAKRDCEKCLRAEPEVLKNREWQHIKFYIYNRITAYKKKVLSK